MKSKFPTLLAVSGLLAGPLLHAQEPEKAEESSAAAEGAEVAPAGEATEPEAPELDPAVVKTDSSYGFGYRSGIQFSQQVSRFGLQNEDLDRETFIKGFFDGFTGAEPEKTEENINAALQALGEVLQKREEEVAQANLEAGQKFLEENAKREGVTTTESGLQYEVLKKGDGAVYEAPAEGSPPTNKQFMVNYRGTLIDGTEFDASPEGETVPMTLQVIPGFKEALTTMPVGSKWRLFIPSELAYGDQRRGSDIKPNSTLIFDLELVNIQDAPAPAAPQFSLPPSGGNAQPGARRPTAVSPPVRVPVQPQDDGGAEEAPEGGAE